MENLENLQPNENDVKNVKTHYKITNILKEDYFEKNGIKNGKYTKYNIDGIHRLIVCEYIDGVINGEYMRYYSNGNIQEITNYVDGKQHGDSKMYYPGGELQQVSIFSDGKLTGESKTYYENGKLSSVTQFMNNERVKNVVTYDKNGDVTIYNYEPWPIYEKIAGYICNVFTMSYFTLRAFLGKNYIVR